jgi:hypothetical protein
MSGFDRVGYPSLMAIVALKSKQKNKDYAFQPFVSIIVMPTYTEENEIRAENVCPDKKHNSRLIKIKLWEKLFLSSKRIHNVVGAIKPINGEIVVTTHGRGLL